MDSLFKRLDGYNLGSDTPNNVTWYSDEDLTIAVSGEQPAGTYYGKAA